MSLNCAKTSRRAVQQACPHCGTCSSDVSNGLRSTLTGLRNNGSGSTGPMSQGASLERTKAVDMSCERLMAVTWSVTYKEHASLARVPLWSGNISGFGAWALLPTLMVHSMQTGTLTPWPKVYFHGWKVGVRKPQAFPRFAVAIASKEGGFWELTRDPEFTQVYAYFLEGSVKVVTEKQTISGSNKNVSTWLKKRTRMI